MVNAWRKPMPKPRRQKKTAATKPTASNRNTGKTRLPAFNCRTKRNSKNITQTHTKAINGYNPLMPS